MVLLRTPGSAGVCGEEGYRSWRTPFFAKGIALSHFGSLGAAWKIGWTR